MNRNQKRRAARIELPLATVAAVDAEYARIPKVECRGKCQQSCIPIGHLMTAFERDRIVARTGTVPNTVTAAVLTAGESCNLLTKDGRCSVYDIRPTVCRLYGVDARMPCFAGCPGANALERDAGRVHTDAVRKLVRGYESPL